MNVVIPEWVAVPVEEVALVWPLVEAARVDDPANRYLLGAVAAFRWALGADPRSPIERRTNLVPSRWSAMTEDMRAVSIVSGKPTSGPDEQVPPAVAAGVAATLGWLLGAVRTTPVRLDRRAIA